MKVLLIIDTWFPAVGGGQINAWEITKRLAKKGAIFTIVTRNNGKDGLPRLKNIKIHKLGNYAKPNSLISQIKFLFYLTLFSLKCDFDLIHVHPFLPAIPAKVISILKKKPVIFTVHGTRLFEKRKLLSPAIILEKFILTAITYNAVITVTKLFLKIPNVNKNLVYIPNGVNEIFNKKVKKTKSNKQKILWVGRFDPIKNVPSLVEAFRLVQKTFPKAELHLVGYGYEEGEIMSLIKGHGRKGIVIKGYKQQKELAKEYKTADVFVLPSFSEGQPLTLLEALASGLPVVATKIGGAPEIVKEGVNGLLVDPNQVKEIANALIKVLNNPGAFKPIDMSEFSWNRVAEKTLSLYKMAIK